MYLAILWQDQLQKQAHIASNYFFHKMTKQHIEIACHFIRKKLKSRDITIRFVKACEKLAIVFIKSPRDQGSIIFASS